MVASLTPPVDKSVHPLEPPLETLLPTPVPLDTYSLVLIVGLVKLLGGVVVHQPVNVSSCSHTCRNAFDESLLLQ